MPPRSTRKKTTKRRKPGKKGALIHFTGTQSAKVRKNPPHADGTDGGVWLLIQPINWWKSNKKLSKKTKAQAIKALRKFKKR
ncbi:MAG TPA: hypothetical protein VF105_05205 [Gemmatimonadaceae bacterium]